MLKMRAMVTITLMTMACFGCAERELAPLTPHVSRIFSTQVGGEGVADVDLLFVIDNSGSMESEQASLRREIPRLIETLTNPPLGADGQPIHPAVESLQIAVVTTNMGTAGLAGVPNLPPVCAGEGFFGEGGRAREDGGESVFLWEEGDDVTAFAARVSRVTNAGIAGCGLEMPLLAATRGLDTQGLLRDDALLAVVILSDEEDCSLKDPAGFFAGVPLNALNQRCSTHPEFLLSASDIVEAFRAQRDEDMFLFAALVGVPEGQEDLTPSQLLALPEMQYALTDSNDLGLEFACTRSAGGERVSEATPGRRYLELADRIPGSLVRSICSESYQSAITELAARIGSRIDGICAVRSLEPDADGAVVCTMVETLPVGMECDALPGRSFREWSTEGRAKCEVQQAVRGLEQGWRYEIGDGESCEQIAYFPSEIAPPNGTRIALECLVEVDRPVNGEDPNPVGP